MSHHLDAPLARQNGQLYIDDLCVFPANGSTVFVMDVNSTITEPHVQPGFHHEARYEFKVHFDGAEFEDLTYRVSFDEREADGRQVLRLHALTGEEARGDSGTGELILEGQTGETASNGDVRIWAGRITDWFYIDLSLLFKINAAVKDGTSPDLSEWRPEAAQNSFANTTVESIVLEVSHQHPKLQPGAHIGVWCATKLATDAGGWRQINRAGHPMMWPLFWPDDTKFDNPANARHPSEDFSAVGRYIGDQVAAVVSARGTSVDPRGLRRDCCPAALPRCPAVCGGNSGDIRLRRVQRPDAGRQRTRSNAVTRPQQCGDFGPEAIGDQGPAGRQLPVRAAGVTARGRRRQVGPRRDRGAALEAHCPRLGQTHCPNEQTTMKPISRPEEETMEGAIAGAERRPGARAFWASLTGARSARC